MRKSCRKTPTSHKKTLKKVDAAAEVVFDQLGLAFEIF